MPADKPCVLLYGDSSSMFEIRAILDPSFTVVTRGENSRLPEHVRCVVGVSESWDAPRFSLRGMSALPIVLIRGGPPPPDVHPSRVFECIDQRRIHTSLHRAVTSAVFEDVLARLRILVTESEANSRRVRVALLRALGTPPVLSVQRLAFEARCNVRSLQRDWKALAGANGGLRMKDVLSAIFWVRAMESWVREESASWAEVAAKLNVTPTTLRRLAEAWHRSRPSYPRRRDVPKHLLRLEAWLHSALAAALGRRSESLRG